jgi:hypothetical protein
MSSSEPFPLDFPDEQTRPRMMAECTGYYCRNRQHHELVPITVDPFIWEIYDERVLVYLCEQDYQERCDDI